MKNNIARDFNHLNFHLATNNAHAIAYELCVILENCIDDDEYRNIARENIIALSTDNGQLNEQLKIIAESNSDNFKSTQPIATDFFNRLIESRSATTYRR